MNGILILFVVIAVLGSTTIQSYAHSTGIPHEEPKGFSFIKSGILFKITNLIEDVRINLASPVEKLNLIKEFAQDKQDKIDKATRLGQPISLDVNDRLQKLITKSENIGESKSTIDTFKKHISNISEMNQIRVLYSQFPDCIKNCTELEKKEFNDKVNSLKVWQEKCSGTFDIDNYDFSDNAFGKLSKVCPDLTKYSKHHLRVAITGNV